MKTVIINDRTYVEFWHRCSTCRKRILVRFEEALAEGYRERKQYCKACAVDLYPLTSYKVTE
jgi:hypothetical protein